MLYGQFLGALALTACFVGPTVAANEGGRGGQGFGNGRKGFSKTVGSTATSATAVAKSSVIGTAASVAASATASATSTTGGSSVDELNPANVQTGSEANGLAASGAEAGQAASATDAANFINFCTGKTLTNGLQVKAGSCNGIVMGDIPASTNMVSTIILDPQPGQDVAADTTFNVTLQMSNLAAGAFTNPDSTYYAAPQQLKGGIVVGHTHVTIQTLGNSLTPSTAPDPSTFAFFKGINDAGNGQGLLSATVAGGLPAGNYRLCTLSSSANHQPVLMPVAQRGAQDDCTKFTVGGSAAGGNGTASATGSTATSTAAAGTSTTVAKGTQKGGQVGGKGGKGGKGGAGAKPKFAKRAFTA